MHAIWTIEFWTSERRIRGVKCSLRWGRGSSYLDENVNCMHERVSVVLLHFFFVAFWPFVCLTLKSCEISNGNLQTKFFVLFVKLTNDWRVVRCSVIVEGVNHLFTINPFLAAVKMSSNYDSLEPFGSWKAEKSFLLLPPTTFSLAADPLLPIISIFCATFSASEEKNVTRERRKKVLQVLIFLIITML